ncbi:MAG: CDP-diacylglycerol--serine O-phosphatidyltransferase [Deltaproteobacteria bacterium]|nr:MAG: CDP-diacylglycerol--serine O-phosphatidyltransferase [Deltaproteobacteria bacterium]
MKFKKRVKKNKKRKNIYILPNILTTGNLFFGFFSLISTINGKFSTAAIAIFIAAMFDQLDGRVARLTKSTSCFGGEYDSLADLVSFGIAPGILIFLWALKPYGRLGWLAAFLFVACGALRLARFNVQATNEQSKYFKGLPIPVAASMIASTVLLFNRFKDIIPPKQVPVLILTYILAFLMVSRIKYDSFKDWDTVKQKPFEVMVLIILFIVLLVAEPALMLFLFTLIYILLGPVHSFLEWQKIKKVEKPEKESEEVNY